MTNACEKWRDLLLEAALTGAAAKDLEEHLRSCTDCAAELKKLEARKARLDTLLPMVVQGAQPSADFRARVLAAAKAGTDAKPAWGWRAWTLAGSMVTAAAVLLIVFAWQRREAQRHELAVAEELAEWRAPSDTLLATPGMEMLRATPKLGQSYLKVPVSKAKEE